MNKKLLESNMKLHGDTNAKLAKHLGISPTTFSYKKNESRGCEFTQREISKIKEKYSLSADDVDRIFFTDEVS